MASNQDPEELTKRRYVRIPREHLNPKVSYQILNADNLTAGDPGSAIRKWRRTRGLIELGFFGELALKPPVLAPFFFALRLGPVYHIQKEHNRLSETMKDTGILNTKSEGHYPKDWMNPTVVSKTHPVFYVTRRGDVILKRPSRSEYMRYRAQQNATFRALGLNPWRWRVHFTPLEAPEKVRVKVGRWARGFVKSINPTPQPIPVRVPTYRSSKLRPRFRR